MSECQLEADRHEGRVTVQGTWSGAARSWGVRIPAGTPDWKPVSVCASCRDAHASAQDQREGPRQIGERRAESLAYMAGIGWADDTADTLED